MATKEEIREDLDQRLRDIFRHYNKGEWVSTEKIAGELLTCLDSQGGVIKVEGKWPLCPYQPADDGIIEDNFIKREAWIVCRDQFRKAGFTAVEPLA